MTYISTSEHYLYLPVYYRLMTNTEKTAKKAALIMNDLLRELSLHSYW